MKNCKIFPFNNMNDYQKQYKSENGKSYIIMAVILITVIMCLIICLIIAYKLLKKEI